MSIELDRTEAALALAGVVALQTFAEGDAAEAVEMLATRLEASITEEYHHDMATED